MDVLSEVLKAIRLDAAFFYNAEFTAPWSFRAPRSEVVASHFWPSGGQVIIYHLLTEGRCVASIEGGNPLEIGSGDIGIFPHGDAHTLGNGSTKTIDLELRLREILAQGLKLARAGSGGEMARIVCGYMSCDPQLSSTLLAGLPTLFRVPIRDDAGGQWLENTIRFSVDQAGNANLGGEAVLSKLSEVLFVETIRRYVAQLPPEETGWLAGARGAEVGRALALLHREPAKPWTIAMLARVCVMLFGDGQFFFSACERHDGRSRGEALGVLDRIGAHPHRRPASNRSGPSTPAARSFLSPRYGVKPASVSGASSSDFNWYLLSTRMGYL